MFSFPDTDKKLKAKISSYKSSFNKEVKSYGCISDGSGKRYLLFSLYLVLNDLEKFEEYIDWYNTQFSDDVGEPIQKLCWAIGLLRMRKEDQAKDKLGDLMLSNLYIIPRLLGDEIEEYDMWHASNSEYLDYWEDTPHEVVTQIQDCERAWMREQYESFAFRRMRKRYVEIYHQLQHTRDVEVRRKLIEETYTLLDYLKE